MFTLDRLRTTHWTWLINTENDRYIFFTINFFILNLCSCLQNIIDSFALRLLFIFNLNIIFKVTKFTFPNLLFFIILFFNFDHTMDIQVRFTLFTWNRISCSKLSFILQSWKSNFENICIYLLSVLSCRLFLPLCFL